jgi:hypothetical protein
VPHFGSTRPDTLEGKFGKTFEGNYFTCFEGYIYTSFFYTIIVNVTTTQKVITNWRTKEPELVNDSSMKIIGMNVSDPFLTVNLENRYKDNYRFSLDFAAGLIIKRNPDGRDKVTISMGKGDYYTSVMDFDLDFVLDSITEHDVREMDMSSVGYHIYFYEEGGKVVTVSVKDQKVLVKGKPDEYTVDTFTATDHVHVPARTPEPEPEPEIVNL